MIFERLEVELAKRGLDIRFDETKGINGTIDAILNQTDLAFEQALRLVLKANDTPIGLHERFVEAIQELRHVVALYAKLDADERKAVRRTCHARQGGYSRVLFDSDVVQDFIDRDKELE